MIPRGESVADGELDEAVAESGEVGCKEGVEEEAVKGAKKSKGAAVVGGGAKGSTFIGLDKSSSMKLKYEPIVGSGIIKGLGGVGGRAEKDWEGEPEEEREEEAPAVEEGPFEGPAMRSMLKKSSKFGWKAKLVCEYRIALVRENAGLLTPKTCMVFNR